MIVRLMPWCATRREATTGRPEYFTFK